MTTIPARDSGVNTGDAVHDTLYDESPVDGERAGCTDRRQSIACGPQKRTLAKHCTVTVLQCAAMPWSVFWSRRGHSCDLLNACWMPVLAG